MKLTTKEKLRLVGEGFITAGIIILMYLAGYQIFQWFFRTFPEWFTEVWMFGDIVLLLRTDGFLTKNPLIQIVLVVLGGLAIAWRLRRRYRQYELDHIISELHYIAQGNFSHRITGKIDGDLNNVVDSIHQLVDSTLAAMEEERRVERTKDELITNVSHDIRTPLTSIIGYLGLVEQGHYKNPEEALRYVHTAFSKAKQMKVMVDDLFEYTTTSDKNRQKDLHVSSFDMVQLLEQLLTDFQLQIKASGFNLTIKTPFDHLIMEGDPNQLVRVFNNLLTNAFKYGQDGSDIIIEIEKNGENTVQIIVRNNGEKIPEEALGQLFERFYRGEEARTQASASTGLGLAIAKNIVELHRGTITAQSNDEWTSFIICLPIRKEKEN